MKLASAKDPGLARSERFELPTLRFEVRDNGPA
jgi:hypothetical protein